MNNMKKILLLQALLLFVAGSFAQRPDYTKMSPLVREAATDAIRQSRQVLSVSPKKFQPTITAFAKFSSNAEYDREVRLSAACKGRRYIHIVYSPEPIGRSFKRKERIANRSRQWQQGANGHYRNNGECLAGLQRTRLAAGIHG